MNEVITFALDHWMLSGAFVAVLILFIANEIKIKLSGQVKLSNAQVVELINHKNAKVLDIRAQAAFSEGHIVDSMNQSTVDEAFIDKISNLKTKPLVVVCEQGFQSPRTVQALKKAGFEQVYYLAGGLAGWKAENLLLTKDD